MLQSARAGPTLSAARGDRRPASQQLAPERQSGGPFFPRFCQVPEGRVERPVPHTDRRIHTPGQQPCVGSRNWAWPAGQTLLPLTDMCLTCALSGLQVTISSCFLLCQVGPVADRSRRYPQKGCPVLPTQRSGAGFPGGPQRSGPGFPRGGVRKGNSRPTETSRMDVWRPSERPPRQAWRSFSARREATKLPCSHPC